MNELEQDSQGEQEEHCHQHQDAIYGDPLATIDAG